jgi:hypothetical protein
MPLSRISVTCSSAAGDIGKADYMRKGNTLQVEFDSSTGLNAKGIELTRTAGDGSAYRADMGCSDTGWAEKAAAEGYQKVYIENRAIFSSMPAISSP